MECLPHECGVALVRLRKPLDYYTKKYKTPLYALERLYLLMHKQRNRGQDGCGVGVVKTDPEPGYPYMNRYRSVADNSLAELFAKIERKYEKSEKKSLDLAQLRRSSPFLGAINVGHLRYTTFGNHALSSCHPLVRRSNWRAKSLMLLGNFNMTNSEYLYRRLIDYGQHPQDKGDTVTVMEKIGYFLEEEVEGIYEKHKKTLSKQEISERIAEEISIKRLLSRAGRDFDGGYVLIGVIGYGASFVARDPNGIRPAYYYVDEEVVVAASERPPIQAAFGAPLDDIHELPPAHALIVEKDGRCHKEKFLEPGTKRSCAFERIYFSHAADPNIYKERKTLGNLLALPVLQAANFDVVHTVFTYIPQSAEIAFIGLMEGVNEHIIRDHTKERRSPRVEKLLSKDQRLRTFIANQEGRNALVHAVYNVTFGVITPV